MAIEQTRPRIRSGQSIHEVTLQKREDGQYYDVERVWTQDGLPPDVEPALAEPQNTNGYVPDWLRHGIIDATGYELTRCQHGVVWNLHIISNLLDDGYYEPGTIDEDITSALEDQLAAFLRDAGLRAPHFKPAADTNPLVLDVCDALRRVLDWRQAVKRKDAVAAARAAYLVATFIGRMWIDALRPDVQRYWNRPNVQGSRTNSSNRRDRVKRVLAEARNIWQKDPSLSPRSVAKNLARNPQLGGFHGIYRILLDNKAR